MEKTFNGEYIISVFKMNSKSLMDEWSYHNIPSKKTWFGLSKTTPIIGWQNFYASYHTKIKTRDYFGFENNNKDEYLIGNDVYHYPYIKINFIDKQVLTKKFQTDKEANEYYDMINSQYITKRIEQ